MIKSENVMKRKGSTQGELYKEEGSSNNAILENVPVEIDYSEALLQSVEQAVEIADIMLKILDTNPGAAKDGDGNFSSYLIFSCLGYFRHVCLIQ